MESTASGLLAGLNAARRVQGEEPLFLPPETILGSLANYIAGADPQHFQPMNANFGILPPLDEKVRGGKKKNGAWPMRAGHLGGLWINFCHPFKEGFMCLS